MKDERTGLKCVSEIDFIISLENESIFRSSFRDIFVYDLANRHGLSAVRALTDCYFPRVIVF